MIIFGYLIVKWQLSQMQFLESKLLYDEKKFCKFVSVYLMVVLLYEFYLFLVSLWGRCVKRRKRSRIQLMKYEVSLA